MRLALREVEQHLGKVAVGPSEPGAGVRPVVNADRLMNEAEAVRVLCHDAVSAQYPWHNDGGAQREHNALHARKAPTENKTLMVAAQTEKVNAHVGDEVQRPRDVLVIVGSKDGGNLGHRPGMVHVRQSIEKHTSH